MSIDVDYFSFSPSRADREWPHFVEDLSALRRRYASARSTEQERGIREIVRRFQPRLDELVDKRKERNSREVDWAVQEEQIRLHQELRAAIANFSKPYAVHPVRGTLNRRQERLDEEAFLNHLPYADTRNLRELRRDLKKLDIFYGAVASHPFEDEDTEDAEELLLESIIEARALETEDGLPIKSEWIRLFQSITPEYFLAMARAVVRATGWSQAGAELMLKDYLRSIKPLAKDLKETPDAVLMRAYGSSDRVKPVAAETLLDKRARQHIEMFAGSLKPVL